MSAKPLLKQLVPFLLAFVLPLVAVYAWWGGFRTVQIQQGMGGPYTYAYLEQKGDYSKLPDLAGKVVQELEAQHIQRGLPITVLYSNPDLVDVGDRVGRAGYLLPPGAQVRPPLLQDTIPSRPVLKAQVQAGSLLAPGKAYSALDAYLQSRNRGIVMPTVEIYEASGTPLRMGVLTVEMDDR